MLSLSAEKIRRNWVNHSHPLSVDGTGIRSLPVTDVEINRLRENFLEHFLAILGWSISQQNPSWAGYATASILVALRCFLARSGATKRWGGEMACFKSCFVWRRLMTRLWHNERHKICEGISLTVSPVEWWAHAELLSEGAAARCCDCWGCQLVGALPFTQR